MRESLGELFIQYLVEFMIKNPSAVALGKLGGSKLSEKKAKAARENGKKGGRPKKLKTPHHNK